MEDGGQRAAKSETPRGPEGRRGALRSENVCKAVTDVGSHAEDTPVDPVIQADLLSKLQPGLSEERIRPYLVAAGFDRDRTLRLYIWSVELGAAFHLTIQAVEVALRNRVDSTFTARFGAEWWGSEDFKKVATRESLNDIQVVLNRIAKRKISPVHGQVVSGLSFGFWVGLLQPRYNPSVWSGGFRKAFPEVPVDKTRADLIELASNAARLRNRIDHHEPIFHRDPSKAHSGLMELLGWICPHTLAWIQPQSRVSEMLRCKP